MNKFYLIVLCSFLGTGLIAGDAAEADDSRALIQPISDTERFLRQRDAEKVSYAETLLKAHRVWISNREAIGLICAGATVVGGVVYIPVFREMLMVLAAPLIGNAVITRAKEFLFRKKQSADESLEEETGN